MLLWFSRQKGKQEDSVSRKIIRMISLVLVTLHINSCLFFFIGRSWNRWYPDQAVSWYYVSPEWEDATFERGNFFGWGDNGSVDRQYLVSTYWVFATLTVNGQVGDVTPQNNAEVLFSIALMATNMTLYSWIMGEISGIIMSRDAEKVKLREGYNAVVSFVTSKKLPQDLSTEIKNHYHASRAQISLTQRELFNRTSHSLRVEISRCLYRELISDVEIFQGCSEAFLDAVCLGLEERTFKPEELIFSANTTPTAVYIVQKGEVDHYVESSRGVFQDGQSTSGGALGALELLYGIKHLYTARVSAGHSCVCLCIKTKQIWNLLSIYPEVEATLASRSRDSFQKESKAMKTQVRQSVSGVSSASRGKESSAALSEVASKVGTLDPADDHKRRDGSDDVSQASSEGIMAAAASDLKHRMADLDIKRKGKLQRMLCLSAHRGDFELVNEFKEKSDDAGDHEKHHINSTDENGRTCLHVASCAGHADLVSELIDLGADVTLKDRYGNTALNDAVREGQDSVAEVIRTKVPGAKLALAPLQTASLLCQAAFEGNIEEIERLVTNGAEIDASNADGRRAIHVAAAEGRTDVVQLLLKSAADPRPKDKGGRTPLFEAVREDREEVQKLLTDHGVRLGEEGEMEYCVRMCELAATNNLRQLEVMVNNGCDVDAGDYDLRTPLHLAASNNKLKVLEYMLEIEPRINVNPVDRFGGTPLEDAYRHGNKASIEVLTAAGGLRKDDNSQDNSLERQMAILKAEKKKRREPLVLELSIKCPELAADKFVNEVLIPNLQSQFLELQRSSIEVLSLLEGLRNLVQHAVDVAGKHRRGGKATPILKLAERLEERASPDPVIQHPQAKNSWQRRLSQMSERAMSPERAPLEPIHSSQTHDQGAKFHEEHAPSPRPMTAGWSGVTGAPDTRASSAEPAAQRCTGVTGDLDTPHPDNLHQKDSGDTGAASKQAQEVDQRDESLITLRDSDDWEVSAVVRGKSVLILTDKQGEGPKGSTTRVPGSVAAEAEYKLGSRGEGPVTGSDGRTSREADFSAERQAPPSSTTPGPEVADFWKARPCHIEDFDSGVESLLHYLGLMRQHAKEVAHILEPEKAAHEGEDASVSQFWNARCCQMALNRFRAERKILRKHLHLQRDVYKLTRRILKELQVTYQRTMRDTKHSSQMRSVAAALTLRH